MLQFLTIQVKLLNFFFQNFRVFKTLLIVERFLDEMYAAIDEQEKVYTSGSETYAQIQPMTTETNRNVGIEQVSTQMSQEYTSAPQPPSVDSLRHVAHAHSRQGVSQT